MTPPVPPTSTDASGTITTGGVAQLLSTITPSYGVGIYNTDLSNDLWIATGGASAAPNANGSIRIAANGGAWETPPWFHHKFPISIYGSVTGQGFTAILA